MVKDPRKHRHDKAAGGRVFDIVKGVWVYTYMEQKCSKCGIVMGKRLVQKVKSPLRARLGPKAGKHALRRDPKEKK